MSTTRAVATLNALAHRQLGLFTRRQALGAGVLDGQLTRLVAGGIITRVHTGVYALTSTQLTFESRALAAVLAAGPRAVASHRTALVLLGFTDEIPGRPAVTVPKPSNASGEFDVHRCAPLRPAERVTIGAVPATSAMRTLVDVAGELPAAALESALDAALRSKKVSRDRLLAYLGEPRILRRRGTRTLRILLRSRGAGVSESELETVAFQLLRWMRLPTPVRQHRVRVEGRDHRIDLAYPDHLVAIELDGATDHSAPEDRAADAARQRRLERAGWRVLRFTWADVTERRWDTAVQVVRALGLRPRSWQRTNHPT